MKYFGGLDLMKFFMAVAIMLAHIASEDIIISPVLKNIFSIYNFGVPFFFACSGYLFFKRIEQIDYSSRKAYLLKFVSRILKMYLVWSLIYFTFIMTDWLKNGVNLDDVLSYLHRSIIFTTYATIWFLPALLIGVLMVYYVVNKFKRTRTQFLIALSFYLFGALGYSYLGLFDSDVIDNFYKYYDKIFLTTRNGLFAGFPLVYAGYFLTKYELKFNSKYDMILAFAFSIMYVIESVFIKYNLGNNVDMGLFLIPSTFFILSYLSKISIKPNKILLRLRNLSMLIFLSQRLFISAIPSILSQEFVITYKSYPYLTLFVLSAIILTFSILIEALSKRYKLLKILW